jgi:hypothetical protein
MNLHEMLVDLRGFEHPTPCFVDKYKHGLLLARLAPSSALYHGLAGYSGGMVPNFEKTVAHLEFFSPPYLC